MRKSYKQRLEEMLKRIDPEARVIRFMQGFRHSSRKYRDDADWESESYNVPAWYVKIFGFRTVVIYPNNDNDWKTNPDTYFYMDCLKIRYNSNPCDWHSLDFMHERMFFQFKPLPKLDYMPDGSYQLKTKHSTIKNIRAIKE